MRPMYGKEIYNIILSDPEIYPIFKGVLAYDQIHLIQQCKFPASFILNSDKSDSNGEHWILIFLSNKNFGLFYDPLCLPFQIYSDLFLILFNKCKNIISAPYRVQSIDSSCCGYHTLFFLFLLKIFSPQDIFNDIYEKSNPELNDQLAYFCVKLFKK